MKKSFLFILPILVMCNLSSCKDKNSPSNNNNGNDDSQTSSTLVDLGLPSGTLWESKNEKNANDASGLFTFDEAMEKFNGKVPSDEQCQELLTKCTISWSADGCVFTGPNNKSITLPLEGYKGEKDTVEKDGTDGWYWTSVAYNDKFEYEADREKYALAMCLFNDKEVGTEIERTMEKFLHLSVRLVNATKTDLAPSNYVDLGLPSGTLWESKNEINTDDNSGLFTFSEAVSKYGNQLPNNMQLQELIDECEVEWLSTGCKLIGPNKNFITLPADGYIFDSDKGVNNRIGSGGIYWSSQSYNEKYSVALILITDKKDIEIEKTMNKTARVSVRLVK